MAEVARREKFQLPAYAAPPPAEKETWREYLYWTITHFDVAVEWYMPTQERKANGVLFHHPVLDMSMVSGFSPATAFSVACRAQLVREIVTRVVNL